MLEPMSKQWCCDLLVPLHLLHFRSVTASSTSTPRSPYVSTSRRCGSSSQAVACPTTARSVNFDDVELGWEPVRKYVPMYLPATSRPGLRLAGQIADGVLLNAICSPEYSANALKIVRTSVEEAGRDWSEFKVAQLINCSVEDDHENGGPGDQVEVASKLDPIQLPFIAGPKMRVGEPYIKPEDIPIFEEAWKRGGKQALIDAVPDSYVEGMTASGTPDEVVERVQKFRDVGVDLPILRPAAAHQAERLLDLFAPARDPAPAAA